MKHSSIRHWLEKTGLWLSCQATFTLFTLLIFVGIAVGLWTGRQPRTDGTRGSAPTSACSHVSVDFAATATGDGIKRLLRAADAYIVYGPDEFGAYQLRFAESTRADGPRQLKASPVIASLQDHAGCL